MMFKSFKKIQIKFHDYSRMNNLISKNRKITDIQE